MTTAPGVGAEFAGYRIESVLGRGGVGLVYLAQDLDLPRRVALKILRAEYALDPDFRERFVRESLIAASLDHQNIVPIYKAGEVDGVLYIAMRYVDGIDLRRLLAGEGNLGVDRTIAILGQIGAALEAAHARGLCHRDVKPANILVTTGTGEGASDQAYLVDFGITKRTATAGLTQVGHFVGTIDYAAPEQIRGMAIDARTDVYSLGCVLYECLAGAPPFRFTSDLDTMQAHISAPRPSLSAVRPEMGSAMDHVVRTAMAVSPGDRYGSTLALVTAMRAARPWSGVDRRGNTRPPSGETRIVETPKPPVRKSRTKVSATPPPTRAVPPPAPPTMVRPQAATVAAPQQPAVEAPPTAEPPRANLMPVLAGIAGLLVVGVVGVVLLAHRGGDTDAPASTSAPTLAPTPVPTPTVAPGEVRLSTALLTLADFVKGTVTPLRATDVIRMEQITCAPPTVPAGETDQQRVAFSGVGSTADRQYYNGVALFATPDQASAYLQSVSDLSTEQRCPARYATQYAPPPDLGPGAARLVFSGKDPTFIFDALYFRRGRVVAVIMVSRKNSIPPQAEAKAFAGTELNHIADSTG
ncbi:MAG TPA: protein kinase [Candidatus Dormibacteraeota bacterium]|nr:protein kinase [Candidatus Dormibacteraeota bacterium]